MSLLQSINSTKVAPGTVSAWWLSGSGFVFKTPAGTTIYVDPYLSDSVHATFGFSRAVPIPIDPAEARPDAVVSTHWHEDHLDPGTIPVLARHSVATRFIMPPTAMSRAIGWGVPPASISGLRCGEQIEINKVRLEAVPARHDSGIAGWEAPDAIGLLLHFGSLVVYHTGDTEYDVRLRELKHRGPDVLMACINGVTGNMDAHEAALLCWQLRAGTVLPIHHLLWQNNVAAATLDPELFAETYRNLGGTGQVVLPEVGREIVFSKVG